VMRRVKIALTTGLTLLAIAIGLTLLHSPMSVARTNGISGEAVIAMTRDSASACQGKEVLPAETSAIRLTLVAEIGPKITVAALFGKHALTHGARGAGWTGGTVTIPVKRVSHTTSNVDICFALGPAVEDVRILGQNASGAAALSAPEGQRLAGRMRVEYLRQGHASWSSLLPSIARRMGLGHAWGGTWIVLVLLAAMASGTTLASWLIIRELR
jgi:hypothetical protein